MNRNSEMKRRDWNRDYHIEVLPVPAKCKLNPPAKVIQDSTDKQHPEHNPVFMALIISLEECSKINNECDGCQHKKECIKIESALSEKDCDKPISIEEARGYLNRFLNLILGRG